MMRRLFARKTSPATGGTNRLFLAAFGKHPGWNDHIEDLGLETDLLVRLKRTLYLDGIGSNVDSGAWEKLSEAQRLAEFDHLFFYHAERDVVLGRMWSSMDGKGRTRYPMVVCAHCSGLPLPWVFQQVLPCLEDIRTRSVNTVSSLDVKSILDGSRRYLRELTQQVEVSSRDAGVAERTLGVLARCPEMGKDHVGLLRVLYKLEQGAPADNASGGEPAGRLVQGSLHIRVPLCADSPANAIRLWLRFLLEQFDPSNAMILLLPVRKLWIDVIVGQASAKDYYCIRASLEAVPRTTDIPYTLGPGFLERAERRIAAGDGGAIPGIRKGRSEM